MEEGRCSDGGVGDGYVRSGGGGIDGVIKKVAIAMVVIFMGQKVLEE